MIFDQICFNPIDAKMAVDLFSGRVKRYIFISSMAVYDGSLEVLTEQKFDPYHYHIDLSQDHFDIAQ
ncbi:hypothetical protein ACFOHW_20470 [Paenibacillus abyssi]|uniref:Uncharacterized protein n=1 Tax=Paenibacillus abyssi TaxID=1340531 RepID=A0A917CK40_9BACL|nr:hypothetical protein GCM10010916_04790 [Paenibacillus abyssi]